jgi:hypothetical protein
LPLVQQRNVQHSLLDVRFMHAPLMAGVKLG